MARKKIKMSDERLIELRNKLATKIEASAKKEE